jgi:UrcA family protein
MKSTIKRLSSVSFTIAAFIVLAMASSVQAQTLEPLTKRVSYADLNLDSQQGAKIFYGRVRSAAKQVCSPFESRDASRMTQWQTCVNDAVSSSVAQVNNTRVTALYNESVKAGRKT